MPEIPGIQQKISHAAQNLRAIADAVGEIETELYRGTTLRGTHAGPYAAPTYPIGEMAGSIPAGTTTSGIPGQNDANAYAWQGASGAPIPGPAINFGACNAACGPIPAAGYGPAIPVLGYNPFGIYANAPFGFAPAGTIGGSFACAQPGNYGPGIGMSGGYGMNTGYGVNPGFAINPGCGIGPSVPFGANATPYGFGFPQTGYGNSFGWTIAGVPCNVFFSNPWGMPSAYGIAGCTPIIGVPNFGYPMSWTWNWDRNGQWANPTWSQSAWTPNGWSPNGWTPNAGQTATASAPQG